MHEHNNTLQLSFFFFFVFSSPLSLTLSLFALTLLSFRGERDREELFDITVYILVAGTCLHAIHCVIRKGMRKRRVSLGVCVVIFVGSIATHDVLSAP